MSGSFFCACRSASFVHVVSRFILPGRKSCCRALGCTSLAASSGTLRGTLLATSNSSRKSRSRSMVCARSSIILMISLPWYFTRRFATSCAHRSNNSQSRTGSSRNASRADSVCSKISRPLQKQSPKILLRKSAFECSAPFRTFMSNENPFKYSIHLANCPGSFARLFNPLRLS